MSKSKIQIDHNNEGNQNEIEAENAEIQKPAKKKKPNLRAGKNKEERKYCDTNDLLKYATQGALLYQQNHDKSTRIDAERMRKKQLAEQLKEERREARLEKKAKEAELLKAKVNANLSEKKKIKKQIRDIRRQGHSK